MIAMQYKIDFPDTYDMAQIRQRIVDKGPLLDGWEGLIFKAYLYSETSQPDMPNRYAPIYLWRDQQAIWDFLSGPGFAGLCADFGRPKVNLWYVTNHSLFRDLNDVSQALICESGRNPCVSNIHADNAASVVNLEGVDPWSWQQITVDLANDTAETPAGWQAYRCGYLARGAQFDFVKSTV